MENGEYERLLRLMLESQQKSSEIQLKSIELQSRNGEHISDNGKQIANLVSAIADNSLTSKLAFQSSSQAASLAATAIDNLLKAQTQAIQIYQESHNTIISICNCNRFSCRW